MSAATVSFVLTERPGSRIPAETEARVRAAAAELDYRPSSLARSLRTRTSNTIGLVSDALATTPYAVRMVEAAVTTAREHGYLLFLIDTGGDAGIEEAGIAELDRHHVERTIYARMHHQVVRLPDGIDGDVVLLDASEEPEGARGVPSVVPDERQGAFEAVAHLTGLGHRSIAYLTEDDPDAAAVPLRLAGYRDALLAAGIDYDESLVSYGLGRGDAEGGEVATNRLLERGERPTAIFCFNDRMAMGCYRALRKHGLEIPRDVSVVGFDNQELIAAALDPPLTTAELPHAAMGRWAVETLLSTESDGESGTRMACPLVIRQSTGAPPDRG